MRAGARGRVTAVLAASAVGAAFLSGAVATGRSAAADTAGRSPAGDDAGLTAARRRAAALADQVTALRPRVDAARAAYERSLADVADAVTSGVAADRQADAEAASAARARAKLQQRVRAVYVAGGSSALYASVLQATSPADVLQRAEWAGRIVAVDDVGAAARTATAAHARRSADATLQRAAARVRTARDVTSAADALASLLAEQQRLLDEADAEVRELETYRAAQAALTATRSALAADTSARISTARALPAPASFLRLYRSAAASCPGLSWSVLAAIGQVESGHGRSLGPSSAGAVGPMQFLPATFAAYAVDGDRDGDRDVWDPADAVFTAARYLCANGAGAGNLEGAIWRYNHADWYVRLVLRLAQEHAAYDASG